MQQRRLGSDWEKSSYGGDDLGSWQSTSQTLISSLPLQQ